MNGKWLIVFMRKWHTSEQMDEYIKGIQVNE